MAFSVFENKHGMSFCFRLKNGSVFNTNSLIPHTTAFFGGMKLKENRENILLVNTEQLFTVLEVCYREGLFSSNALLNKKFSNAYINTVKHLLIKRFHLGESVEQKVVKVAKNMQALVSDDLLATIEKALGNNVFISRAISTNFKVWIEVKEEFAEKVYAIIASSCENLTEKEIEEYFSIRFFSE